MSFADPLVITVNAVAKSMARVNSSDPYSSEYFLKEALEEFRVKIRHSDEKSLVKGGAVARHNVEFTNYVYPTAALPNGVFRQVYTVIRNNPADSAVQMDYLSDGLADWVKTNAASLVGWVN
jgi:hypothetical protein